MTGFTRWRRPISYAASCLAAVLAITAVFWGLFVDRELYDLRWKLRPGEVLRYRTVMLMGTPDKQTHQVMILSYTVGAVDPDGTAEVTSLVEQVTMRKGGPEGPVVWDSAAGTAVPKGYEVAMMAAMTGVPIRMKVDVRGLEFSKDGMEKVEKRANEMLGWGDNIMGAMTGLPFSGSGGTIMGAVLPPGPVRRGADWMRVGEFGTQAWGKHRSVNEYSLSAVKGGVATIRLTGSRTLDSTPGDLPKAMKIQTPPDPNEKHGNEDVTEFSISGGVVVSQRDRTWLQSTTAKGSIFRFECSSESTLIERRAR